MLEQLQRLGTFPRFLEWLGGADAGRPFAHFPPSGVLCPDGLAGLAGRVAAHLAALGMAAGDRVAVLAPTSPALLAGLMGLWRLGAIVCPADIQISAEALARLLAMFRPRLVLVDPGPPAAGAIWRPTAQSAGVACLALAPDAWPAARPEVPQPAPGDPALCIYTSGSTGNPKGVLISHANLVAGAANLIAAKAIGPGDRALCVLPLSHMNGLVTTFLSPLASGGQVVFFPGPFDPAQALALIDQHRCTWFSAVPTHYAALMNPPVDPSRWSLASLRFCRSASAPLSPLLLADFERHYRAPIVETMGMTETTGQIFSNPLPPGKRKPGSIGRPVGFQVRVVDDQGRPLIAGQRGEIEVKGPALMLGYLDDPAETAKAMDGHWLRSGDIGEADAEGYYYIKGRKKDIAIFCGLNISLRALEMAVEEAIGRPQAVACVGRPHASYGETVRVYALDRPGLDHAGEARRIAGVVLPLLPNRQALEQVCHVAAFPRSGVGKVLKGRLAEAPLIHSSQRALPSDPRGLLAEVLGLGPEAVREDMAFRNAPGWDSLAQVALLCAVETLLDRRLSVREMALLRSYRGLAMVLAGDLPPLADQTDLAGQRAAAARLVEDLVQAGLGSTTVTYLIATYEACAQRGVEDPSLFIEAALLALPAGSSLVMNGFSWKFCAGAPYHHAATPCEVGLVNEFFRRRPDVIRGPHPIYSYLGWGPEAAALVAHDCPTCWGAGSATRRLLEREDVSVVTLGVPFARANPAMHALEEMHQAPYRFYKTFSGTADFGQGPKPYSTRMFVRPLDDTVFNDWSPLADLLIARGQAFLRPELGVFGYLNRHLLAAGRQVLGADPRALLSATPPAVACRAVQDPALTGVGAK